VNEKEKKKQKKRKRKKKKKEERKEDRGRSFHVTRDFLQESAIPPRLGHQSARGLL
jgi:hypothetical protein